MQTKKHKWITICLIALLLLSGCTPVIKDMPQTLDIYATFYPLYALTQQIAEDAENVEIHCLVQPQDDCLREYELSDWDLYMLGYSADAVIAAGNGLEGFTNKLHEIGERVLPVAEVLIGVPMEQFQHMPIDEDSHFSGDNPHVYMSLNTLGAIVDNITGALSIFDVANADLYEKNGLAIQKKLDKTRILIEKQTEVCTGIKAAVLHESLLYPAQECGLNIAAIFERESGEMLYADGLADCIDTLKSAGVQLVLLELHAPTALVDALTNAGYCVVQLDVLSAHCGENNSVSYVDVIADNAQKIIDACRDLVP